MVELECQKCGYEWNYQGEMEDYATCPRCKTSVALPNSGTQQSSTIDETERELDIEGRLDRIEEKLDLLTEVVKREYYDESEETDVGSWLHKDSDEDDGSSPYDPTEDLW